jgi:hypothetical protein
MWQQFEERQKMAGGRLGETELEEAMEKLFGDFRIWRKLGKTHRCGAKRALIWSTSLSLAYP